MMIEAVKRVEHRAGNDVPRVHRLLGNVGTGFHADQPEERT